MRVRVSTLVFRDEDPICRSKPCLLGTFAFLWLLERKRKGKLKMILEFFAEWFLIVIEDEETRHEGG